MALLEGRNVEQDLVTGESWLRRAALAGDPQATTLLAAANPSTSGAWPIAPARRASDTASSTMYMPANDVPHANTRRASMSGWAAAQPMTGIRDGQISALRSDASAWDWPVGLLCSALSFMGDIGTGGSWPLAEKRHSEMQHSPPQPRTRKFAARVLVG
jgi:hypothetical protein